MGGTNPYLPPADVAPPKGKYRVRFVFEGGEKTVEVDPAQPCAARDGLPFSLLRIALDHDVPLDHACGGVCACSTCHVIVREGLETCNEPLDQELDKVDEARGVTPQSRLGCQCVPNGTKDVVVEVPSWNRNIVREAPH
jgi:2Fe-2S ferredoxin